MRYAICTDGMNERETGEQVWIWMCSGQACGKESLLGYLTRFLLPF